jgi:hypothetical protein
LYDIVTYAACCGDGYKNTDPVTRPREEAVHVFPRLKSRRFPCRLMHEVTCFF